MENQDKINELLKKLDQLTLKHNAFSREIYELRKEILALKADGKQTIEAEEKDTLIKEIYTEEKKEKTVANLKTSTQPLSKASTKTETEKIKPAFDIEKFIGENLINKIGIAITIIGVAIGAKYSIEHDLISPLTRIILGYLAGLGLLGVGIKLKKKYEDYSAVLVSGAIAIMYFITYAAYSFYDLFPQVFAFGLMLVFTVFTVVAAISYNRQVIAHIGLVGSYAVPMLLSEGSGNVEILFSYITIINIGILFIAFKKYWKPLYYVSFLLTWFMYFGWYASSYQSAKHFNLALIFLTIFFTIFYLTFLIYKLRQKEKFVFTDIWLVLANSFVFYGLGYAILSDNETGVQLLGLFTLVNAIIHFIVSTTIYRKKLADKNLFYLVIGMVLVFITIAIPVQLDGNWVTLIWVGEAALLFWIGRTKNVAFYEKISYLLMALAFFSILHDWSMVYNRYYFNEEESRITPLLNIHFLTSVLFIAAFGFINVLNQNKKYTPLTLNWKLLSKMIAFSIPTILLIVLYYAFRLEIEVYWNQLYENSYAIIDPDKGVGSIWDYDLTKFKIIWVLNYSMLFFSILSFVNLKKLKNQQLGFFNLILNVLAIAVFLIQGLYELSELRSSYLETGDIYTIALRYISLVFVAVLLIASYQYTRQSFMKRDFKIAFDILLYTTALWVLSSELIHWMDIAKSAQSYKLGLSILWGIFALFVIIMGIWKKKKHLRIGAMALFTLTLAKLFFYDISHLDTISKTIVFVSLGILLLIISFLYNKYTDKIVKDES